MRIGDLLQRENVLLQAEIAEMADVLGILVELQEQSGIITNGVAYYNAVCEREATGGSTALGGGIALPHAVNAGVSAPGVAALTLRTPLDWGAEDGRPVDLVFMLAVPTGAQSAHLQLLARLVTLLSDQDLVEKLRHDTSRRAFVRHLAEAEARRFA